MKVTKEHYYNLVKTAQASFEPYYYGNSREEQEDCFVDGVKAGLAMTGVTIGEFPVYSGKEAIGKKVRLSRDNIEWALSDQAYWSCTIPGKTECERHQYDPMVEINLFMAMFEDEYPGTVVKFSPENRTYWVDFGNGECGWFHSENLIYE